MQELLRGAKNAVSLAQVCFVFCFLFSVFMFPMLVFVNIMSFCV